jgi:hypothetical protein
MRAYAEYDVSMKGPFGVARSNGLLDHVSYIR